MPLDWEGHVFETALDSEERLPEAYPAMEGKLPHEHADVLQRFPRAVACPEPPDRDPPADDRLEVRGRVIGERVVRFANTVPSAAVHEIRFPIAPAVAMVAEYAVLTGPLGSVAVVIENGASRLSGSATSSVSPEQS